MKTALAIFLLVSAFCSVGEPVIDGTFSVTNLAIRAPAPSRNRVVALQAGVIPRTTNATAYIAKSRAWYELIPVEVPLPGSTNQRVFSFKRFTSIETGYTNRSFTLTLRCMPPFQIDISTNLVTWEPFMESPTNEVATIEVCAEQQVDIPNAFFRCAPLSPLIRTMRGYRP